MIKCLDDLLKNNEISQSTYDTVKNTYTKTNSAEKTLKQIEKAQNQTKNKYYTKAIDRAKVKQLDTYLDSLGDLKQSRQIEGINDLITKRKGAPSKQINVEYLKKELHGRFMKPIADHLDDLRSKWGGLKIDRQLLDNISLRIFSKNAPVDGKVSDIVESMQKSVDDVNERLMDLGITPTVTKVDQLVPMSRKILEFTEDEFVTIGRQAMNNTDDEIRAIYRSAKEGDETARANWKGAKEYKNFIDKIGGDSFSSYVGYLEKSAAKIAEVRVLGINAKQNIENMIRKAGGSDKDVQQSLSMLDFSTGTLKQKEMEGLTGTGANLLNIMRPFSTAASLGGAVITAFMDFATVGLTAKVNGLPVMKTFVEVAKNLASKEKRMELAQIGFQLEAVLSTLNQTSRFNPHAAFGSKAADAGNKFATGVLRVSGLIAMTDALKLAVKNTFLTQFKDYRKLSWNKLKKENEQFANQLQNYGMDIDDWNNIRKSVKDDEMVLDPTKIADETTASKVYRMINEEGDYAVITPGARSHMVTSGGGFEKGTLPGEIARNVSQFKSTIVEQVVTHIYRAMRANEIGQNRLAYLGKYAAATTVLGGLVYSLKELSSNKTPVDPYENPYEYLARSMEYGGTIPILTDALAPYLISPTDWQKMQGFSGVVTDSIMQIPALDMVGRPLTNAWKAASKQYLEGDESGARENWAKAAGGVFDMLPGNNIWFAKELLNEYMQEPLQEMIDPSYVRKQERRQRDDLREYDQEYLF